jgi:hypothetical protein
MKKVNFRNLPSQLSLLLLALLLTFSTTLIAQDAAPETPAATGVGDPVAGKEVITALLFSANIFTAVASPDLMSD